MAQPPLGPWTSVLAAVVVLLNVVSPVASLHFLVARGLMQMDHLLRGSELLREQEWDLLGHLGPHLNSIKSFPFKELNFFTGPVHIQSGRGLPKIVNP